MQAEDAVMKRGSKYTPEQKARVDEAARKRAARMTKEQRTASSRRLRKGLYKSRPTLGELVVRYILRTANVSYDWQKHVIHNGKDYYADVFIEPNLLIEIDGKWAHGYEGSEPYEVWGKSSEQRRKETESRNTSYKELGYKTLWLFDVDLKRDMHACVKKILEFVGASTPDSLKEATYADMAEAAKQRLARLEKQQNKERRQKNKEKDNKRRRDRRASDHDWRENDNMRRRQKRHDDPQWRESQNARIRAQYTEKREKIKIANKRSYIKHRAKRLATNKEKYNVNKEKILAEQKEYYHTNRQEIRARQNQSYAKLMGPIIEELIVIVGPNCHWCERQAHHIRTNMKACKKRGHTRRRGIMMKWYVDHHAEAKKFLYATCLEHKETYRNYAHEPKLSHNSLTTPNE